MPLRAGCRRGHWGNLANQGRSSNNPLLGMLCTFRHARLQTSLTCNGALYNSYFLGYGIPYVYVKRSLFSSCGNVGYVGSPVMKVFPKVKGIMVRVPIMRTGGGGGHQDLVSKLIMRINGLTI